MRRAVLLFCSTLMLLACGKNEGTDSPDAAARISRIEQTREDGSGIVDTFLLAYNGDGTARQLVFAGGDGDRWTRSFRQASGFIVATTFDLRFSADSLRSYVDSLTLDGQGRPVVSYRRNASAPLYERHSAYEYAGSGELAYKTYFGLLSDSSFRISHRWSDGDLQVLSTDQVDTLEAYQYENSRPSQSGNAAMLDDLLQYGRIWRNNRHLRRGIHRLGEAPVRYDYTWDGSRIATLTEISLQYQLLVVRTFWYEN